MKAVLTSIQNLFNGVGALMSRFPSGCFLSLAHSDTPLPTCSVSVVSAVPDHNTVDSIGQYRIQFDIYASDGSVLDAVEDLKTAFDYCSLDVSNFMECRRENQGVFKEDEIVWHGFVEYMITVGEN